MQSTLTGSWAWQLWLALHWKPALETWHWGWCCRRRVDMVQSATAVHRKNTKLCRSRSPMLIPFPVWLCSVKCLVSLTWPCPRTTLGRLWGAGEEKLWRFFNIRVEQSTASLKGSAFQQPSAAYVCAAGIFTPSMAEGYGAIAWPMPLRMRRPLERGWMSRDLHDAARKLSNCCSQG
ncbi:unnamed protein product [Symbiodinium microadriaticum]|nr:unnamed protein product [Symbiodinium microadriaticum]